MRAATILGSLPDALRHNRVHREVRCLSASRARPGIASRPRRLVSEDDIHSHGRAASSSQQPDGIFNVPTAENFLREGVLGLFEEPV